MRVLGIDPGSRYTGWGVLDRRGSRLLPVDAGRIVLPQGEALAVRLARLAVQTREIVGRFSPDGAVLEALFHGVNPRSLIVLAQARGVLLATLALERVPIREYSPAEIKSAVTGNGRADKQQVGRMVRQILGIETDLSEDAADALAAAICYAQRDRLDRLGGDKNVPGTV